MNLKDHQSFLIILGICLSYWIYLISSTQIAVIHDAVGYEYLGKMIYEKGMREYFIKGPDREPLYPLLISASMRLADLMAVSYHIVQKIFQVLIYLASFILFYMILTKMEVNNKIKLTAAFYFGVSPAVINAAMSLYSEILTLPFVLAIILLSLGAWPAYHEKDALKSGLNGVFTGAAFLMAALVKGIFQYVFVLYLIPYILGGLYSFTKKDKQFLKNIWVFIIALFVVFEGGVHIYKYQNYKYNGHYLLTNRFDDILFTVTYHRAEPLTARRLITNISSIPGRNFCQKFFTEEECLQCEWEGYEDKRLILKEKTVGLTGSEKTKRAIALSFENVFRSPAGYAVLTVVEFFKIMFWETTRLGFVNYPGWLATIYSMPLFKDLLRAMVSLLTIIGVFHLLVRVFWGRAHLFAADVLGREARFCLAMAVLIFGFGGLYALCVVLTRYAMPIVPLYLLSIAFLMDRAFCPKREK